MNAKDREQIYLLKRYLSKFGFPHFLVAVTAQEKALEQAQARLKKMRAAAKKDAT